MFTAADEITVVIPTRDRLRYLQEAVASALQQQGPPVRVLVVDDGSSDGTPEWLDTVTDARLRWWRNEAGQGGSAARNQGLARVGTPLVLFLDDDDRLRPGALSALAAGLRRYGGTAGAAGAFRRFGAGPGGSWRSVHPRVQFPTQVWRELLLGWNMPPAALLWRTEVVHAVGGWDESLRRCEDRDLNLRAYPRRFVMVPRVVMDYRVHPDQVPGSDHADLNREVLGRFAASLEGAHRRAAEAIVAVREDFDAALGRYRQGDYGGAVPEFRRALRGTGLIRSPVLGPWIGALVVKAEIFKRLPAGSGPAVQHKLRGLLRQ